MEEKKLTPKPADETAELTDEKLDAVAGGKEDSQEYVPHERNFAKVPRDND